MAFKIYKIASKGLHEEQSGNEEYEALERVILLPLKTFLKIR